MGQANGSSLSPSLLSVATILSLAFGGTWGLFQVQLAGIEREIAALHEAAVIRSTKVDGELSKITDTFRSDLNGTFIARAEFGQFQERFSALKALVANLDQRQTEIVQKSAREPVEKATIDATVAALNKQIDLLQGSITDINRQIAAALIIIDNNSGVTAKHTPALPP